MRLVRMLVLAATVGVPAHSFATTINFDSLSDGASITNQFAGLTFTNAIALSAGISLNEFEFPPHSGSTVASDDGGPMRIDFAQAINSFAGFFTYTEPLVLRAFDASNALLGSTSSLFSSNFVSSGNHPNELLQLAFSNMAYVTLTGDSAGSSFTLDDLSYSVLTEPGPSVPEPGTITCLLVGGGALVRSLKRKRQQHS